MRTDVLITMVDDILGNDGLCGGCGILEADNEKNNIEVYGSCSACRRAAATEIIRRLWKDLVEE